LISFTHQRSKTWADAAGISWRSAIALTVDPLKMLKAPCLRSGPEEKRGLLTEKEVDEALKAMKR
jgi:hypothetical protein